VLRGSVPFLVVVSLVFPATATAVNGTGIWNQWSFPNATYGAYIAAYVPEGNRLFAYWSASDTTALWQLSLSDGKWTYAGSNASGSSAGVGFAAMFFDAQRNRLVRLNRSGIVSTLKLSLAPVWTEAETKGDKPPVPVQGPWLHIENAVHDPVRQRILVMGSSPYGQPYVIYELSLADSLTWRHIAASGEAPPYDTRDGIGFDSVHERLIVYGGGFSNPRVWMISLNDDPVWRSWIPTGDAPQRSYHPGPLVYDPIHDRFLMFREDLRALYLTEVPRWERLFPGGPQPAGRTSHFLQYDESRQRVILFGGWRSFDAWQLSLADSLTWSSICGPPSFRNGHSGVFDPIRRRLIVFGGDGMLPGCLNDLWSCELDPEPRWTALDAGRESPPARCEHSAIYDPVRDRMIVFGGTATQGINDDMNDSWALSLSGPPQWTRLESEGLRPEKRRRHAAAYDPASDLMVILGGIVCPSGCFYPRDSWSLSLASPGRWSRLQNDGAALGGGGSLLYDPPGRRLIAFGGLVITDYGGHPPVVRFTDSNTTRALSQESGYALEIVNTSGNPPPPRNRHSMVYDSRKRRMIVYGGEPGEPPRNDMHALALDQSPPAWSEIDVPPDGPPAAGHTAFYDPIRPGLWIYNASHVYGHGDGSLWVYDWEDSLVSFQGSTQEPNQVSVSWILGSGAPSHAQLYRRQHGSDWEAITSIDAQPDGTVSYVDRSVASESRYSYRLGVIVEGVELLSETIEIETPVVPTLALIGPIRNPSRGELVVRIRLPTSDPAVLHLHDVAGRLVTSLSLNVDAGTHTVRLSSGLQLRSGSYFLNLSQGRTRVTGKVVFVR
jgi:hypothetical protein